MELKFICKDPDSLNGHCPAIYEAVGADGRPGLVIQGKRLVPADAARMRDVADDENGTWIPMDLLNRYLGEG